MPKPAISAYELGIETLEEAGFVEIDPNCVSIYAKVLPKARKFEAWMEFHHRRERIRRARHDLAYIPGMTRERATMLYRITVDELTADPGSDEQPR